MGWARLSDAHRRVRAALVGMALGLHSVPAWASVGGGSSRIPLTQFLRDLYTTTDSVWIPLLAILAIVYGAFAWLFGIQRFGGIAGRVLGVIGILTLGVTTLAGWFGGNTAIAMLLP